MRVGRHESWLNYDELDHEFLQLLPPQVRIIRAAVSSDAAHFVSG